MGMLLAFSALIGFGGPYTSLMVFKTMTKWSTDAKINSQPSNQDEAWLMETAGRLATEAGLAMSEVAICEGAPNAFATGPSKSKSRVAVSTGLLRSVRPSMRKHDMSPAQCKPSLA